MVLFELVKLVQNGIINYDPATIKQLMNNKFVFIPIINVDGVHDIEDNMRFRSDVNQFAGGQSAILLKRKNLDNESGMSQTNGPNCEAGVDLNRNYGVDWKLNDRESESDTKNPCSEFYAGMEPFSEPETKAMQTFMDNKSDKIKFVINFHSNGNSFMWPFNGREKNDIEIRAPGVLSVMKDIVANAQFPEGIKTGNAFDVIHETVGGDADDYITATYGIPSVTSELGNMSQFINDFVVKDKEEAYDILTSNSKWVDYIFDNLVKYNKQVANAALKVFESQA